MGGECILPKKLHNVCATLAIMVTQKNMRYIKFVQYQSFFEMFVLRFCGKMTYPRLSNRELPRPNCTKQPCNTCAPCQNTRKCPTLHFPPFLAGEKKPLLQQFVLQRGGGKGKDDNDQCFPPILPLFSVCVWETNDCIYAIYLQRTNFGTERNILSPHTHAREIVYEVITIFHANVEAALLSLSDRDLITTLFARRKGGKGGGGSGEKREEMHFFDASHVVLEQYLILTTIASPYNLSIESVGMKKIKQNTGTIKFTLLFCKVFFML